MPVTNEALGAFFLGGSIMAFVAAVLVVRMRREG